MGVDVTQWFQLIPNVGLPLGLVIFYLVVERPALRKREDEQLKRFEERITTALKEQRGDFDLARQRDRETAIEIQKLSGEIQKSTMQQLVNAISHQDETIDRFGQQLDLALEKLSDAFKKS